MIKTLARIVFCSYSPEGDAESRRTFKKQFARFKKMNRQLMKRAKKGEINSLSYEEEEDKNGVLHGVWTTDPDYGKMTLEEELSGVTFFSA